ncbi:MAG TPA: hypothetical protein VHL09_06845 [Dehalococcoidia bacterium]|nr:hypothetical protein [Dehalococcoidia bacterium]
MNNPSGLYLHKQELKLVRVSGVPKGPEGDQWVKITDDPNTTLVAARRLAGEQGLTSEPDKIAWQ